MARKPMKQIALKPETLLRLKSKAHYGQSIDGVIRELLDMIDAISGNSPKPVSNLTKGDADDTLRQ